MPANRHVPYVNFQAQYAAEKEDILAIIDGVFSRGHFVGGEEIAVVERRLAELCGVAHCVALNSGTDALTFALHALGVGPGDEVITPPNSFFASTAVIAHLGARPLFVDVRADQNIDPDRIEAAITAKTKAIMPVHLTGRVCDMTPIMEIADRHGLAVVEDAAQAIASRYNGRPSGSFGAFGCFSAHPLKNLNAAGDAGFLTTDDENSAERLRRLRNHGLVGRDTVAEWGYVSRMDTLQAAILLMRLDKLEQVTTRRRHNAALYRSLLDPGHVFAPPCRDIEFNTFHTFVVQVDRRDDLRAYLSERGIGSGIHYPSPLHLQPPARALGYKPVDFPVAEAQAGRIVSLPVHQFLDDDDVAYVAETINAFFRGT